MKRIRAPSSGMPLSSVVHASPAATGQARVTAGRRRGSPSNRDLPLGARFGQSVQRTAYAPFRQVTGRAVVDISPYRRMDVVFRPNCPVCETDLASDWSLSTRLALRPNGG